MKAAILLVICWLGSGLAAGEHSSINLEQNLSNHVDFLTTTSEFRNHEHPPTLDSVAAYIDSIFSISSSRVERQYFEADGNQYQNVIASFGPPGGDRIVVGAHYDVAWDQPGADDNASGVAGLLELARLLGPVEEELDTRIDLVAFTLEEPPHFRTPFMGSAVHSNSLVDAGVEIELMISLEMIGYYDDQSGSQAYPVGFLKWFYPSSGDFIAVVSDFKSNRYARKMRSIMRKRSNIKVAKLAAPASMPGVDFSDHLNYWSHGFKAVMITDTAFFRNHNYHLTTDTPNTLDYQRMSEVVHGVFQSVLQFATK